MLFKIIIDYLQNMIEKIESFTVIISSIIVTGITTITALYSIQKSFRKYIDDTLDDRDKALKQWFAEFFEGYYHPIDDRLKNLNYRIKRLEEKK